MSNLKRMCGPDGATEAKAALNGKRLDPLVRYIIVNWALGALAGIICASALLLVDPFGLRPLLFRSDAALAGLLLLYFGFMTTFGGLVCAAAVMVPEGLGGENDDSAGGGLRANVTPRLVYARLARRV